MFRAWIVALSAIVLSVAAAQEGSLRITAPAENENVSERPFVEGTVSDPNTEVWVVVHPMDVSEYWVQPSITVKENGHWKVQAYVGRPGGADTGKHFEVRAFAQTTEKLKEGRRTEWPEAKWKSQVVEVVRK